MSLERKNGQDQYLEAFRVFEAGLNGERETWLHALRREGIAQYACQGIPSTRGEAFRYTNLGVLGATPFAWSGALAPRAEAIPEFRIEGLAGPRLVLRDGRYDSRLSCLDGLPQGVWAGSLAQALRDQPGLVRPYLDRVALGKTHPFLALNTAFLRDGIFLHLPRGLAIPVPVRVLVLSSAGGQAVVSHPRVLIVAEALSQLTVLEQYDSLGTGCCFTNAVTEIFVGASAVVEHIRLQRESPAAYHLGAQCVAQERDSRYTSHVVTLGARVTRNDVHVVLEGEGVHSTLNGFYIGTGSQLIDNHTNIEHAKPNCNSWEVYKGVLDEEARGVFNGRIHVHPGALKTDAKQNNKNLLLSREAEVNTKPQLEIYADDVKCTHGATIGRLDEASLFYLRSRGIGAALARQMLIRAFAGEVLGEIQALPIRSHIEGLVQQRMDECRGLRAG